MRPLTAALVTAIAMLLVWQLVLFRRDEARADRSFQQHLCVGRALHRFARGDSAGGFNWLEGADRAYTSGFCSEHPTLKLNIQ